MKQYRDLNRNSGIDSYELKPDSIIIKFKTGEEYLYNHHKPGKGKVETMKELAEQGSGLTTFINKNIRDDYAKKLS